VAAGLAPPVGPGVRGAQGREVAAGLAPPVGPDARGVRGGEVVGVPAARGGAIVLDPEAQDGRGQVQRVVVPEPRADQRSGRVTGRVVVRMAPGQIRARGILVRAVVAGVTEAEILDPIGPAAIQHRRPGAEAEAEGPAGTPRPAAVAEMAEAAPAVIRPLGAAGATSPGMVGEAAAEAVGPRVIRRLGAAVVAAGVMEPGMVGEATAEAVGPRVIRPLGAAVVAAGVMEPGMVGEVVAEAAVGPVDIRPLGAVIEVPGATSAEMVAEAALVVVVDRPGIRPPGAVAAVLVAPLRATRRAGAVPPVPTAVAAVLTAGVAVRVATPRARAEVAGPTGGALTPGRPTADGTRGRLASVPR
jgi:hypothetical protein